MSTLGSAIGGWQTSNLQLYLLDTIGGAASTTADLSLANVEAGPWPRQNRPIKRTGYQSSGGAHAMPIVTDFQNSYVQRPALTMNLPFQSLPLALALASVLQNTTGATNMVITPYTDPQAHKFFVAETLFTGGVLGRNLVGGVAKSVKISVPPAGADGGTPTLSMDVIGQSSAQITALTGAGTLDSSMPGQSTSCVWTGITGMGHCGFDLNFNNNADWDPQVATAPLAINLGNLEITGSIKVALSGTAGDEYPTAYAAYNGTAGAVPAPTAMTLTITFPSAVTAVFLMSAIWDEPGEPEPQGNIKVVSLPFHVPYVGAASPQITVAAAGTTLTGSGKWA